jgi:hypothetical protein
VHLLVLLHKVKHSLNARILNILNSAIIFTINRIKVQYNSYTGGHINMDLREIGQEYAGRNHLARERAVDGSCVRDTEIPGCIKRGVFD